MRYGHYEYFMVSFGVANAPGVFMQYMNRTFRQYLDTFVVVFINDILIYSKTDEEYVGHLRIVLELLKEKQVYAKLSKCEFWLRGVSFLGHVTFNGGIGFDPSKGDNVLQWETSKFSTEIRRFLGLSGYCRRFIEGFSKLAISLTQLARKGQAYVWDVACEVSFIEIKKKLMTVVTLILPSRTKPFVVYCDASKMGQGGALMHNG
ncbi:uncharacterized mitochondrial protein AtMg00860-like [Lathyrus oleraceus]|uniref:uncharacterized mitochondrial protein AtMg00860-like n=1 Tax=Pisum sativum TaxID=3888 RepID=UPI0021CFF32F|nr:uncharacterized mitochondrial protein AtMg00860-like [Pisum sativum]